MDFMLSRGSRPNGSRPTREWAALLVIIMFSFGCPLSLKAQIDSYGPACGSAVMDGIVDPGEWTRAAAKTFQMVNSANQQIFEATLWVMNDRTHLYLGLTINDDEFSTLGSANGEDDLFRIDFDNNHSGSLFTVGDEVLYVHAGSPHFLDNYINGDPVPSSSRDDISGGGTTDCAGGASRQGNLNHFELKHPLCSGDSRDFCLHPGDRVGFRLEYLDFVGEGIFTGSYLYPGMEDTSLADIVVAECPALYLPLIKK